MFVTVMHSVMDCLTGALPRLTTHAAPNPRPNCCSAQPPEFETRVRQACASEPDVSANLLQLLGDRQRLLATTRALSSETVAEHGMALFMDGLQRQPSEDGSELELVSSSSNVQVGEQMRTNSSTCSKACSGQLCVHLRLHATSSTWAQSICSCSLPALLKSRLDSAVNIKRTIQLTNHCYTLP